MDNSNKDTKYNILNFNYDLERMKQAVDSLDHRPPSNLTFKEFQEWTINLTKSPSHILSRSRYDT